MKDSRPHTSRSMRGFTLLELMIVVAIMSVIILIMYMLWLSMIRSTATLDSKVKMQDQARTGMSHMVRNLRMADTRNAGQFLTTDAGGVVRDWYPAPLTNEPANTIFYDNITFRRPIDADGDGTPFQANTTNVEWSNPITYRLDTNDVNGDGRTLQVVQLDQNGQFVRVLMNDISPVVNSGGAATYDTPSVGGFAIRSLGAGTIEITIVQLDQLGAGAPDVHSRYDDRVTIRN